ncbi:MAG TPA: AAA family ATPase [Gaiellaceae bacterium]|nr:AAA family ATPase [Gaiellaceae bacterium]
MTLTGLLVGRDEELDRIDRLVGDLDALPAALVLEGEAGIGKTTIWEAGITAAEGAGFRVLRATPSEAEASLAFAAAADLLAPIADEATAGLPDVQRRALAAALLLESNDVAADRRAVATAFLGALRRLAASRPVFVGLDDVQWLDAESALLLSFAARRLTSERIGFLLAHRAGEAGPRLELGPNEQRVAIGPLSLGALHRLLHDRLGEPLPRPLLRRIHDVSGGNPFFAHELASVAKGATGHDLPLPATLEPLVEARLRGLPPRTRAVLAELAASTSPESADPDEEAIAPALAAGVVRTGREGLEFTHPLLRAAAYEQLTPARRRELHRRLAETAADAEQKAHHLSRAVDDPDESVAAAIAEGAERARRRGAPAVAAELLDHAARVTEDPERRVRRTQQAAVWKGEAGDTVGQRAALEALLRELAPGPARAQVLAVLADDAGLEVGRAAEVAREGLAQPGLDAAARGWLLLALSDNVFLQNDLRASAAYAREALPLVEPAGNAQLLARALAWNGQLASLTASGDAASFFERAREVEQQLEALDPWRAAGHWQGVSLMWADRPSEGRPLLEEQHERAEELGNEFARSALCFHLTQLECRAGELARASRYAREGHELASLGGNDQLVGILLNARALAAAHEGDAAAARAFADEAVAVTAGAGDAFFAIHHRVVLGFLETSLGDYPAAGRHLEGLSQLLDEMGVREPGIFPFHGDAVEAAVALGDHEDARRLIADLEARGRELARPRLLALAWRGRGMLHAAAGEAAGADDAFANAVAEHERLELPLERARTLLANGVALRRARQKRSARAALEEAEATFEALGARLWAERARSELARVGGRAPSRGALTPTEQRVAGLAAAGKANKEIATELYVTVRTVETHLTKIYEKLGVRGRAELPRRLS